MVFLIVRNVLLTVYYVKWMRMVEHLPQSVTKFFLIAISLLIAMFWCSAGQTIYTFQCPIEICVQQLPAYLHT